MISIFAVSSHTISNPITGDIDEMLIANDTESKKATFDQILEENERKRYFSFYVLCSKLSPSVCNGLMF